MAAGAGQADPPLGVPDGLPASTGLSLELWQAVQYEVYQSLYNPFVLGMAQGTLPRRAFQAYVAQDAYFLTYFARAYATALAKLRGHDEETFIGLTRLLYGVQSELELHTGYAERWGVSLEDCTPSAATLAYTDFLMDVAERSSHVAEILAAMLPCARLYGFIGCTLARAYPGVKHEYAEWIATYSSTEYLVRRVGVACGLVGGGGPGGGGGGEDLGGNVAAAACIELASQVALHTCHANQMAVCTRLPHAAMLCP